MAQHSTALHGTAQHSTAQGHASHTDLRRVADTVDEDSIIRPMPRIPVLQQIRFQSCVPQDPKGQVEQLRLATVNDLFPGEVVQEAAEAAGVGPGPWRSRKGRLLVHQAYMPANSSQAIDCWMT